MISAIKSLDPRARDIVESRWLGSEKTGLKELSEKYNVSMERIRQIEKKAFEKMQPMLRT
jgi:RNA polymerase sigma-32 factor